MSKKVYRRRMNVKNVEKTKKSDEEITFTAGYRETNFIAIKTIVENDL